MAAKKTAEFMLVNRRSKKALQATGLDNGMVVEQAVPTGTDAQLWISVEKDGAVKLINKASGKVLDVEMEGVDNGTRAQTWEDVGGASQVWRIVSVTATYKKIVNARSGKVLDVADMSDDDGAPAQIWEDVDGAGQQWKMMSPDKVGVRPGRKPAAKKAEEAGKKGAPAKRPGRKPAAKKTEEPVKEAAPKAEKAPAKRPGRKPAVKKTEEPVKEAVKKAEEAVKALKKEPEKVIAKVEEKVKTMTEKAPKAPAKAAGKPAAKKAAPKADKAEKK